MRSVIFALPYGSCYRQIASLVLPLIFRVVFSISVVNLLHSAVVENATETFENENALF
jgi:hypothetical protein